MRNFEIIVAVDAQGGIGKDGGLPWSLPRDLERFKAITTQVVDPNKHNAVIMGRKTWESLPAKYRPLPKRFNVIITAQKEYSLPEGVLKARGLTEVLRTLDLPSGNENLEKVFIIGGGQLFAEAINLPQCRKIHMTRILKDFHCDTFFPQIPPRLREIPSATPPLQRQNDLDFYFSEWTAE